MTLVCQRSCNGQGEIHKRGAKDCLLIAAKTSSTMGGEARQNVEGEVGSHFSSFCKCKTGPDVKKINFDDPLGTPAIKIRERDNNHIA